MLFRLCLLAASVSAFSPAVASTRTFGAAPVVTMSESGLSRRAALASAGVAALVPLAVVADDTATEEAMARIAAKAQAKNEAAKEAQRAKAAVAQDKAEKENEGADLLVKGFAAGSFFLSLPFFYKNLARLGLRWSSAFRKDIDPSKYDKGR